MFIPKGEAEIVAQRLADTRKVLVLVAGDNARLRDALIQVLALVRDPETWDAGLRTDIEAILTEALTEEPQT